MNPDGPGPCSMSEPSSTTNLDSTPDAGNAPVARGPETDHAERMATLGKQPFPQLKVARIPDFSAPSMDHYCTHGCGMPTEEESNRYQSASAFMSAVADAAREWKATLPDGFEPRLIAVLNGGAFVQVDSIAQVSFHGIRIQGSLNEMPCAILAHQSTVQMLCLAQPVDPESPSNPIGFIWPENKIEV